MIIVAFTNIICLYTIFYVYKILGGSKMLPIFIVRIYGESPWKFKQNRAYFLGLLSGAAESTRGVVDSALTTQYSSVPFWKVQDQWLRDNSVFQDRKV